MCYVLIVFRNSERKKKKKKQMEGQVPADGAAAGDDGAKRRRKKKEKPPLSREQRLQLWNETSKTRNMKKIALPIPVQPATGAPLLEEPELAGNVFTFREEDAQLYDLVLNQFVSDSQMRKIDNFKKRINNKKWQDRYVAYTLDKRKPSAKEAAAAPATPARVATKPGLTSPPPPGTVDSMWKTTSWLGKLFLGMILTAGLPFRVWDSFYPFLDKCVKGLGGLPKRGQELKERFLGLLWADEKRRVCALFEEAKYHVLALDETTDDNCRSVFAVTCSAYGKHALIALDFLKSNTNQEYLRVLRELRAPENDFSKIVNYNFSQTLGFALDSASVGHAMAKQLTEEFPHLLFLFDKVHLASSVGTTLFSGRITAKMVSFWNRCVMATAKRRRNLYSSFFHTNSGRLPVVRGNQLTPKMPPHGHSVRWLDKFYILNHHVERFELEAEWVRTNAVLDRVVSEEDEEATAVQKMWTDGYDIYGGDTEAGKVLHAILYTLADVSRPLEEFITQFQGANTPLFHLLFRKGEAVLSHLQAYKKALHTSRTHEDFTGFVPQDVQDVLNRLSKGEWKEVTRELASHVSSSYQQWKGYWRRGAATVDESFHVRQNQAIKIARVFDPRQVNEGKFYAEELLETFRFPFVDANNFKERFTNQLNAYKASSSAFEAPDDFDIAGFWTGRKADTPELALFALCVVWLPTSSCEVERFFSAYNRLVDDQRLRLKEETIKQIAPLRYNKLG